MMQWYADYIDSLELTVYPKAHNVSAHTGVVGFYRGLFFVISPRMPYRSLFSLS